MLAEIRMPSLAAALVVSILSSIVCVGILGDEGRGSAPHFGDVEVCGDSGFFCAESDLPRDRGLRTSSAGLNCVAASPE